MDPKVVLKKYNPLALIDELFETYKDLKINFYLGHLRPNEVEGGRFAEVVFRILEYRTTKTYTPLATSLNTDSIIRNLAQLPSGTHPESVRIHIPRTLRVIYDIRNKRDVAHLADGIDPNLQDATLVSVCCDWVLAEIIRLYCGTTVKETQEIIDDLVTRKAPVIQEFGTKLKTLNPKLSLSQRILVILYHQGAKGFKYEDFLPCIKPSQKKNLQSSLWKLEHDKDFIVEHNSEYKITRTGQIEVEQKKLFQII